MPEVETSPGAAEAGAPRPEAAPTSGWQFLLGVLRRHAALASASLGLALLAALFEGTTMGIFAMALETLTGDARPVGGGSYGALISRMRGLQDVLGVDKLFLLFVGLAVLSQLARSGLEFSSNVLAFRLVATVEGDVRSNLFREFMARSFADMLRHKLGDLTSYMEQVTYVGQAIRRISLMANQLLLLGIYVVVLLWLSWPMTIAAVLAAVLLSASLRRIILTVRRIGRQFKTASVALSERTVEFLHGLRLVHTFAREDYATERVEEAIADGKSARQRGLTWQASISPIVDSLTVVGVALFLGGGYLLLGDQGPNALPRLATFLFVLYRLAPRLRIVNDHYGFLNSYSPFLDRVAGMLHATDARYPSPGKLRYRGLRDRIEFDNVSMRYLEGDRRAVREVSFDIPRGHMVALVGESGSGKTTLADLLIRLYDPTLGELRVDGVDLRDLDWTDWRDRIGSVSQETFIFHASVRENIAFGRPTATQEEIVAAARAAHAHGFISEMAGGYDTIVGDQGYRLSGGQRQRLAIARAVLRDPELLILDEATSDLDSHSEKLIQEAMGRLRRDRTVLSIAHRLSTIAMADQILVLDRGRIVERGNHHELLALDGHYARLWRMQLATAEPDLEKADAPRENEESTQTVLLSRDEPQPRETLFVFAHRNHLKCLLPVIERLAGDGGAVHCAIPGEVVAKGRVTRSQLARLRQLGEVTVMRKGLGEAILARLWPRRFPRPHRWARRLARLLARRGRKPAVLAIPLHPPNFQYLRDAVGGSTRIVCIQHDPYHTARSWENLAGFRVDVFCVWGEHMRAFLEQHGAQGEIRITGAPHLRRRALRARPHAPAEAVSILYATQPGKDLAPGTESVITAGMKRRAVADLLACLVQMPRARLTIKLHPVDDGRIETDAARDSADRTPGVVVAPHDPAKSINDYIDSSDVVVTILSTVAFEALVRGKPVILLNYDNIVGSMLRVFGSERDYLSEGSALEAVDGSSLMTALREVLYGEATRGDLNRSRERFLSRHLEFDSQAAIDRICSVLTPE